MTTRGHEQALAKQKRENQNHIDHLQQSNTELLRLVPDAIAAALAAADAAGEAARQAESAATRVAAAGGVAKAAATTAKQAAKEVGEAARAVDQAVTPPPVVPAEAPEWHGGS